MDRRSFLALLGSAPIAALTPPPMPEQHAAAPFGGWWLDPRVVTHRVGCFAPGTLATLADYSLDFQRQVASDTLGCDSLDEYLSRPETP